ncbi:MAG: Acetyltransferase [uncultured Sphingomonadaceae bacterium]|uniref:Acetyltransferase n=1 Tax=uncultured Sphingomonadaceae bacterium TaxID=169976 RepID=A0A6J4TE25_9SPHN|nr:MAG: Acetyltransferase [uncultured Sphingomonadaceae bacterium]
MKEAMDLQPTLAGDAILLRPLRADDHSALYVVASDPLIWALHPAHDRHEPAVFRAFFDEAMASGGALVAVDRASGAVIGSSRYDFRRAEPGEVEIGWTFVARSHWGGATNREMKRLMLRHALGAVDAAIFLVGETNLRSRRALEKIGARLTARTHRAVMAGRPAVHVVYAMDAGDYAVSPLAREEP